MVSHHPSSGAHHVTDMRTVRSVSFLSGWPGVFTPSLGVDLLDIKYPTFSFLVEPLNFWNPSRKHHDLDI